MVASQEADPAAGAEIAITVPGRAIWEVKALHYNVVADATVTNRRTAIEITDGENRISLTVSITNQAASNNFNHTWLPGITAIAGAFSILYDPIPLNTILLPGWQLNTVTANLQAGDNFGPPMLWLRETPQRGLAVGQDALLSALRRLIGEEA